MKKYNDLIINFVFVFMLSTCFNLILFKYISLITLLYIFITSSFIACIIKLLSDAIKSNITKKLINLIPLLFINLLFIAQVIHYCFYSCFFSFYSLTKGGQVFEFIPAIMKVVCSNIFKVSLFIILMIVFIIVTIKTKYTTFKKKTLIEAIIILIIPLLLICFINIDKTGTYSSYSLMHNINNNTMNINKFGLIKGMSIDFYRYFNEFEPKLKNESSNAKTYDKERYNITDLNFDKPTNDKSIEELNNYFKNVEPTNKNEYTGIFKDKNLIFITAESFDFNIINQKNTPTLYKMKNEGLYFVNHYTPIFYASTSDGEYMNLTGLLPKEGIWSYIESKHNYYPYTYGNVFNDLGYKTYSYHNGKYNFYDRNIVQPKLGFNTFKACGKNLNIDCNKWPQSDEEMINKSYHDYKNDKRFVAYYMSISGHLSHSFKLNDMAKKHENDVKDLKYSNSVKAYISGNIDLDKALELLINNLKKDKKLDDTVIVIIPDHFPYGLSKNEIKQLQNIDNNYDLHKTGLIIYNSTLKPKKIKKLSSNIDVLPTLLNMYGINYDSRILIGKDIMSNNENQVMFNDQSFLTSTGYYNPNKFKDNKKVINKYSASNIIIDKNYYSYLFK